jgi:hypothetical protein
MTVQVEFCDDVQATAERIWDVLTDVQHYPDRIQDISAVEPPAGPVQRDTTFRFKLSELTYGVTVLEAERPRRLTWYGVGNGLKTTHEWERVEAGGQDPGQDHGDHERLAGHARLSDREAGDVQDRGEMAGRPQAQGGGATLSHAVSEFCAAPRPASPSTGTRISLRRMNQGANGGL